MFNIRDIKCRSQVSTEAAYATNHQKAHVYNKKLICAYTVNDL